MKNIQKYISVVVIAIAMTITFLAIKSNKTNNSVKMQNKEALAGPSIWVGKPCAHVTDETCTWNLPTGEVLKDTGHMEKEKENKLK